MIQTYSKSTVDNGDWEVYEFAKGGEIEYKGDKYKKALENDDFIYYSDEFDERIIMIRKSDGSVASDNYLAENDFFERMVEIANDREGYIYMRPALKNYLSEYKEYKKGGKIKIVNEGEKFDEKRYEYLLDDFDGDGTKNVDDKYPYDKTKKGNVEGSNLSESLTKLIDLKDKLDDTMYETVDKLAKFSPTADVYARTKTPFSIINKLVKKRLTNPNKGLTDLVGTTIAVDNYDELLLIRDKIRDGELGTILEEEDFYDTPNDGYRAIHYILMIDGNQVELQLKTKRIKELNELTHGAYKSGKINVENAESLYKIAEQADKGDYKSIKKFDSMIKDKDSLKKLLTNE